MKIAITQEIIDEANRLRDAIAPSLHCPVALAIKAVVKPGTYVAVGNWNAYIGNREGNRSPFSTPEMRRIISDFDASLPLAPCEIKLPIPEEFIDVK
jgi:hypothetical protein